MAILYNRIGVVHTDKSLPVFNVDCCVAIADYAPIVTDQPRTVNNLSRCIAIGDCAPVHADQPGAIFDRGCRIAAVYICASQADKPTDSSPSVSIYALASSLDIPGRIRLGNIPAGHAEKSAHITSAGYIHRCMERGKVLFAIGFANKSADIVKAFYRSRHFKFFGNSVVLSDKATHIRS